MDAVTIADDDAAVMTRLFGQRLSADAVKASSKMGAVLARSVTVFGGPVMIAAAVDGFLRYVVMFGGGLRGHSVVGWSFEPEGDGWRLGVVAFPPADELAAA